MRVSDFAAYNMTGSSDRGMRMMLIYVWILLVPAALAYPNGAPTFQCVGMTPGHGGIPGDHSSAPFSIEVLNNKLTYSPGEHIQVGIRGGIYKGLLLQARSVDPSDTTTLGHFVSPPANTKLIDCGEPTTAVTHSNRDAKDGDLYTYTWVAPASSVGDVMFVATVVQNFRTYWVKLESSVHLAALCHTCASDDPCDGGNDGAYFCFVGDTKKFIQCGSGGQCHEFTCPATLVWDTKFKVCNWP